MGQFDGIKAHIVTSAEQMHRMMCEVEKRYENASTAGTELAAEVYRFLSNPPDTGRNALYSAYDVFMSRHSGNFSENLHGT